MTELEKRIEAAVDQAISDYSWDVPGAENYTMAQYITKAIMPIVQPIPYYKIKGTRTKNIQTIEPGDVVGKPVHPERTARMTVFQPPMQFLKKQMTDQLDFSIETLQNRVIRALETRQFVDPMEKINFNGVNMRILDLPGSDHQAMMGYGHFPGVLGVPLPRPDGVEWAYTPETCQVSSGKQGVTPLGVWIDEEHLVCPGCGLDLT